MLGYSHESFLGKAIWDIGLFKDIYANKDKFIELQQQEYVRYKDLPLETADGRKINVEFVSNVYSVNSHKVIQCNIRDITERKQAEEFIRESEERYRSLLNNLDAGIVVHAPDTSIVLNNHRASVLLGLSNDQLLGKAAIDPKWKFVNQEYSSLAVEDYPISRIVKGKKPIKNQILGIHHPGKNDVLWVNVNGFPVLNNAGELTEIVISFIDITDRKKAEEALRESEKKYRNLIENMGEGIVITDENEKFVFVNPTAEKIFGVGHGELIDNSLDTFHSREGFEEVKNRTKERRQGISNTFEDEIILKDGSKKNILVRATPWIDKIFKGTYAIVSDITERKQAEEELKQSNKLNKSVLDCAGEGVIGLDTNGYHTFVNPKAAEMLGYTVEELTPLHSHDTFHHSYPNGENYPCEKCPIYDTVNDGKSHSGEEYFWRKDGTGFWAEFSSMPLIENERIAGSVVTFRDITERKKAEEEIKASEEKYRNLIETMPEGFYRSTPEGYFVDANPALVNLLGYDSKEELMKIYIPEELYFSKDDREVDVS